MTTYIEPPVRNCAVDAVVNEKAFRGAPHRNLIIVKLPSPRGWKLWVVVGNLSAGADRGPSMEAIVKYSA